MCYPVLNIYLLIMFKNTIGFIGLFILFYGMLSIVFDIHSIANNILIIANSLLFMGAYFTIGDNK